MGCFRGFVGEVPVEAARAADGAAMDAVSVEDVIFLVLTFFLAVVVSLGVVIWGRSSAARRL